MLTGRGKPPRGARVTPSPNQLSFPAGRVRRL